MDLFFISLALITIIISLSLAYIFIEHYKVTKNRLFGIYAILLVIFASGVFAENVIDKFVNIDLNKGVAPKIILIFFIAGLVSLFAREWKSPLK